MKPQITRMSRIPITIARHARVGGASGSSFAGFIRAIREIRGSVPVACRDGQPRYSTRVR